MPLCLPSHMITCPDPNCPLPCLSLSLQTEVLPFLPFPSIFLVHLWKNSPGICSCLAVQQGSYLQGSLLLYCRREQERREERQRIRSEAGGVLDPMDDEGSFDDGDPYTTNLYIGAHHNQTPLACCSSTKDSVLQMQIMHVSYSIKMCKPETSLAQLC